MMRSCYKNLSLIAGKHAFCPPYTKLTQLWRTIHESDITGPEDKEAAASAS